MTDEYVCESLSNTEKRDIFTRLSGLGSTFDQDAILYTNFVFRQGLSWNDDGIINGMIDRLHKLVTTMRIVCKQIFESSKSYDEFVKLYDDRVIPMKKNADHLSLTIRERMNRKRYNNEYN